MTSPSRFQRLRRAVVLSTLVFVAGYYAPVQPFTIECEEESKWVWQRPMRHDALLLISEVLSSEGWRNRIFLGRVWTAPLQGSAAPARLPHVWTGWQTWRMNWEDSLVDGMAQGASPSGRRFEPPQELVDLRHGGQPVRGLRMFVDPTNPRESREWSDCHIRHAAFMAE